jgi:hypothetical protein
MLKTLRKLHGGVIAALLAASLGAQTPSWNLPADGYVYDSIASTIRPVLGFPGSSYAGPAVLKGVAWASVAPGGRAALIVQRDRLWWTQDLSNANIPPLGIDAIDSVADCRWSADASAAVILSSGTATVTWLSGPRVTNSLRLPALPATKRRQLPGREVAAWKLLAADSHANSVLLASNAAGVWTLWLASPNNPLVNLGPALHPVAAVFAQRTPWIYVAEADAPRVSRIQLRDGTAAEPGAAAEPILGTDEGIQSLSGLALSADDQQLFAADRSARVVRVYDLGSHEAGVVLPLSESPGVLLPLGSGQFLVNSRERPDAPLLLLDTSGAPRVWFVPMGAGQ